jgi:hypothetical protein
VDESKPQVVGRLKELGNLARAFHILHMTETGHDDGYFSMIMFFSMMATMIIFFSICYSKN